MSDDIVTFPTLEPAFPQHPGTGNLESWRIGMSLRDYFAAKAMQAFLTRDDLDMHYSMMAQRAYSMADAMLKEREK